MDGTIIIWDTEKREAIHSITIEDSEDDYYITDNALSADGEMLVRSKPDLGSLEVVEVETGKLTLDLTSDQAEPAFYYALSFSNDSKKIAAISFPKSQYFDQTITQSLSIWDATSGEILIQKEIKNKYVVQKTIFSRDDQYLVIASPQQMFMLDAENGEQKYEFGGWSEISFSPDNKFIAYDNADAGIYIADTATGKLVTSQRFGGIYDLSYSPDGKTIAICGWDVNKSARLQNNTLVFMEATDPFKRLPNKLDSFVSMVNNLEYSPDGSQVVITDFYGNLYVIDSTSLELVAKLKAVAIYPRFVSFTPDGQSIVVGNADGIVKFYSLD
jgi:WD40 repeat protein